jgi:benzoyl-CoA reductase/2-hydroxyglutaryl-CoA dehydratase subunit BcrC/BadD/HgdB
MWSGLELDLKSHDALLSVLSGAYQEIFLSQNDRPAGMKHFDFVMSEVHGLRIKELLDAIADRYFRTDCAVFTPNRSRVDHMKEVYQRLGARGATHYSLQFCYPYTVESGPVEAELEKVGIPVLRLETDYSQEHAGQIREAFRERIETR